MAENRQTMIDKILEGIGMSWDESHADHRRALERSRSNQDLETDDTLSGKNFGSNRTITTARELIGTQSEDPSFLGKLFKAHPDAIKTRKQMGMGLSDDNSVKTGQILGTIGSDLIQDRGRAIWWLLNAPQASANVLNDLVLKNVAPDIYKSDPVMLPDGKPVRKASDAIEMGLIDPVDQLPMKGVDVKKKRIGPMVRNESGKDLSRYAKEYRKRRHRAVSVDALGIPVGFAINSGIGLMNPLGGSDGYKAVFADEDDQTKTTNVIGEIGAKYLLGRTGDLLPWMNSVRFVLMYQKTNIDDTKHISLIKKVMQILLTMVK